VPSAWVISLGSSSSAAPTPAAAAAIIAGCDLNVTGIRSCWRYDAGRRSVELLRGLP